jgi:hypothetical protein
MEILSYQEYHRRRDRMAMDQRNFEVHKKYFGW